MHNLRRFILLDHTADLSARLVAESREGLFEAGAELLFELLTDRPPSELDLAPLPLQQVRLVATGPDELFARWLEELVFLLDAQGLAPLTAQVQLTDSTEGTALRATLGCVTLGALGAAGVELLRIPKAVTRHKLRFEPLASGQWVAEVIFDV
jgi:SHS2 domain-containing protein